ncbi:MAG: hypothetical protein US50_C0008G0010 [Candidatus Nomurabacteria bacterium GW2011_GWB1_37_5]|uniref:Uncharacterized protein n=1 Tax=Candidatus Nomurabacteria bacterium GW2011_GWB1_37_5 TaxID=1618742 RepID=A0A0G0JFY9_9BACT|nr:MAG: hypothetical protein US50_C0008G0010 [Candidatus Nomurabacteria bacterium GW2011_GWB1_37_5]
MQKFSDNLAQLLEDVEALFSSGATDPKELRKTLNAFEAFLREVLNTTEEQDLIITWRLLEESKPAFSNDLTMATRMNKWGADVKMQMKKTAGNMAKAMQAAFRYGRSLFSVFAEATGDYVYFNNRCIEPTPLIDLSQIGNLNQNNQPNTNQPVQRSFWRRVREVVIGPVPVQQPVQNAPVAAGGSNQPAPVVAPARRSRGPVILALLVLLGLMFFFVWLWRGSVAENQQLSKDLNAAVNKATMTGNQLTAKELELDSVKLELDSTKQVADSLFKLVTPKAAAKADDKSSQKKATASGDKPDKQPADKPKDGGTKNEPPKQEKE